MELTVLPQSAVACFGCGFDPQISTSSYGGGGLNPYSTRCVIGMLHTCAC